MAGLGETLAGLARLREGRSAAFAAGEPVGLVEVRGFAPNPGQLRMLTYVPEGLPAGAPLVVVLHGCTQRAGAHAGSAGWLTLADRLGFAVLAPEQSASNNPNLCFNWFEPHDISRGAGEAASIHAMTQAMIRTHALDADRVFVTGLSAGGAMTAVLLAAYPETYAAGAVVAGMPYGAAVNVQEAFGAMRSPSRLDGRTLGALVADAAPRPVRRPRLSIWHGQADTTVSSGNAEALVRQWSAWHGLSEAPDDVEHRRGYVRAVWRGPDGEALIERNLVAGLAHGTPLATGGPDPIGTVGPFMLEAGISSSLEIARFWGLAPELAEPDHPIVPATTVSTHRSPELGDAVMAAVAPHVPQDVGRVISDALRTAGLLR